MKAMIGIGLSDSRFIGMRAWMTRKISAESWKEAVFEISLSSWVIFEWFTQRNFASDNRTLSPFSPLKLEFLSRGSPLINIYIMFLILIRGYSKTQKRPFFNNIYVYILYTYTVRIPKKFLWVNYSKTLKKLKGNCIMLT